MNYKVVDKEKYYRKGVYRHFTQDCKCSTSMTAKIDVTPLKTYSEKTNTKFYIRTMHHPELYKFCDGIRLYIDGETDEWTFPLGEITGQFTRREFERLIPSIKEALQMLEDKVYNTQHYIIEF